MRLLKWLFQPAYLLLFIVIIALYVNREALFPEEIAESLEAEALLARIDSITETLSTEAEEAVEGGRATPDETTQNRPDSAAVALATDAAEAELEAGQAAETTGGEGDGLSVPAIVTQQAGAELAASDDRAPGLTEEAAEAQVSESVSAVSREIAQGEVTPLEDVSGEAPAESAQSPLALWQEARRAVWQGDLEVAVSHYRGLIALQPDNYDAYGEMGNVLLAQQQTKAAAEAYATAARLIYLSGNREIAYRVAAIVAQLDREQSQVLRQAFTH